MLPDPGVVQHRAPAPLGIVGVGGGLHAGRPGGSHARAQLVAGPPVVPVRGVDGRQAVAAHLVEPHRAQQLGVTQADRVTEGGELAVRALDQTLGFVEAVEQQLGLGMDQGQPCRPAARAAVGDQRLGLRGVAQRGVGVALPQDPRQGRVQGRLRGGVGGRCRVERSLRRCHLFD